MLILIFLSLTNLRAQDYLPFINDNYAGITGVHLNPASIADSRYKVDITLAGLSLNMYNNYLYLNRDYLSKNVNHNQDIRDYLIGMNTGNGKDKFVYQDMRLDILNFMVTINPRLSIGFTAGIREYLNVDNINEDLADLFYNTDNSGIPVNQLFKDNHLRLALNSWAEYGISVAGVLYKTDKHIIKAGMNMKLIQGLGSAYLNIDNLQCTKLSDSTVNFNNTHFDYGMSNNFGNMLVNEEFNANKLNGMFSMGFDFGVIWEWRPDYKEHLYDMDGETGLERRENNKYKLRVGLSIKDIGFVKYRRWSESQDFTINGVVDINMFDGITNYGQILDIIEAHPDLFTIEEQGEIYRMSLPTSISLQVDYNIYKDFYVNFTPYLAFRQGNNKYTKVHAFNNFSLTPRYERKWFGVSIPLQYNQLSGFSLGTGLRLGPVWVGSNNVLNTLFSKEIDNINIQALVKIPIPYNRVKDSDGDGVSDKIDQCKDVWGTLENYGCPDIDRDNDGIPDDEDVCPDIYGLAIFDGCPDSDNDSIPDHLDECPNIAGLAKFNGCPDTDGDSIPDHLDKCPTIPGLAELDGCPRADTDNDGIPDIEDECPEIAGPVEFNGCPDSDGDGIRDIDDECPNIAGLAIFNGCPDSDNDSIPDHLDKCPLIAGIAAFDGCPDTDGDGIQDSEDECPEEPGTPENNGCPIYEKVEFATHIGFQTGSSKLTAESYPYLDQLVQLMIDNPDCWVKLDGHTDNTGSDAINNKLSQQRVDSIKFYLVDKGINPNRIIARGHGSSKPIAPNDTAEGRAKNRRVEINLAH